MGGLGSFFNQITKPVGIKLFKGGPYDGRDKVYEAGDIYGTLAGMGSKMLGLESPNGDGGVQNLGDMLSGLTSRLNDLTASGGSYTIRPSQRQQLNQQIGAIGKQRQSALSSAKQRLLSRGITGPAYEAALARINEAYDAMQDQGTAGFMEQARTSNLGELGMLMQQLLGLHQYGTGLMSGAAQGKMGVGAAEAQAAQQAISNLMGAIGTAYGMGFLDPMLPEQGKLSTYQRIAERRG